MEDDFRDDAEELNPDAFEPIEDEEEEVEEETDAEIPMSRLNDEGEESEEEDDEEDPLEEAFERDDWTE